jgi:FdhD protein
MSDIRQSQIADEARLLTLERLCVERFEIHHADRAMNRPLHHNLPPVSIVVDAICKGRMGGRRLVCVAEEIPIAFRYNGFPHAVMMATPCDLEDFALGFSVTEGIIAPASDLPSVAVIPCDDGVFIDISLKGRDLQRYLAKRRVRQLRGHTSCGLCGVEDLDDVSRPVAPVHAGARLETGLIHPALDALRSLQPLSRQTRGAHASAWVGLDGELRIVREDVGRHNALDKLIGAMARSDRGIGPGFCLITSRCSFEMVQKAVAVGFPALVSAGAPTSYAIRLANAAGLQLYSIGRDGQPLLYTSSEGLENN